MVNHVFQGGNNPRTEEEILEGVQGTPYKIKNRSNSAYTISEHDIGSLTGTFKTDSTLYIYYNAKEPKPTSIELVPETYRLGVGETVNLGYKLLPEANYVINSVEFEMVENENVAIVKDIVLTGREIGFGMIRGTVKGNSWVLSADGAVMVSGATEEGE